MLDFVLSFALGHLPWLIGGGAGIGLLALIPVAGPVLAFLALNWRWVVPLAVAAVLGAWVGVLTIEKAHLETTIAEMKAVAAKELADAIFLATQQERSDLAYSNKLNDKLTAELYLLKDDRDKRHDQYVKAPATSVCIKDSGPARTFFGR